MVDICLPDLPDDILRLIVKYILCDDNISIQLPAQEVQQWPQLRYFHGPLDMFDYLFGSSALSATGMVNLPVLRTFWLQSAEYRVYQPVPLFPPMPRLVTASFFCMAMSPMALAGLNTAAPGLRTLSVFEGQFAPPSSDLMPSRITFASLTKLSVTGVENAMGTSDCIDAPHLAKVTWDATGSPVLPIPWHTVTLVSIESHAFGKDDVRISGATLSALPHLKTLYLPGRDLEWTDAAPTFPTVTHLRASPAHLAAFLPHALPNLVHLESMGSKDPPFRALPTAAALSLRRITGNLHPTLIEQLARMPQLKSIDGRYRVDVAGDAPLPEWTLEYSQGHVVWTSVPRMELTGRFTDRLVVRAVSVEDAAKAVSDIERMLEWIVMGGRTGEDVEPIPVELETVMDLEMHLTTLTTLSPRALPRLNVLTIKECESLVTNLVLLQVLLVHTISAESVTPTLLALLTRLPQMTFLDVPTAANTTLDTDIEPKYYGTAMWDTMSSLKLTVRPTDTNCVRVVQFDNDIERRIMHTVQWIALQLDKRTR
ncbi:hypothetical protein GGF31_007078 [Allomyces arbusculus]|nr:hypothetical protein GGF31_007078 [Allomyces arbusculus]